MQVMLLAAGIVLASSEALSQVRPAPRQPIPRIDAQPLYTIPATTASGEIMFERVGGAALLPIGGVVLADAGSNRLLRYDARGIRTATAGGTGRGPGEFSLLWGAVACRGVVIGVELVGTTVQEFSPDGRHRRSVTLATGLSVRGGTTRRDDRAATGDGRGRRLTGTDHDSADCGV